MQIRQEKWGRTEDASRISFHVGNCDISIHLMPLWRCHQIYRNKYDKEQKIVRQQVEYDFTFFGQEKKTLNKT